MTEAIEHNRRPPAELMPPTGIGARGQTLRQLLAEGRRLWQATGCYAGITEPKVLRRDPIKAELFHSRMLAALIAGRETTRMISGSPYVREVAELAIGIYTPEGDNIAQSTGIQVHIRPMGEAIQWMIEHDWEERVGIRPGDLFWFNECSVAGMHPADVYDILPIFWEGELVAWACTVIMEMDIGAVSPGCMPVPNVERATDGIRFAGEKVGSNDRLRHDIVVKCELSFDMADMFLLDRKGAIAANMHVRREVEKLIREFGLAYFEAATRELIEEERRHQLDRLRQRTIPGRYRNVAAFEYYMAQQPVSWLPAKRDVIRLAPLEMRIDASGTVALDFEGAGDWGWHNFNATPSGMWGCLSIGVVQTLSYDGRANLGSLLPFDLHLPHGSLFHPEDTRPLAQANIWATAIETFCVWLTLLSHAYYMRGFHEEMLGFRGVYGVAMAGYDQYGKRRALIAAGTGTLGSAASGIRDGLDPGGLLHTPEPDSGNTEIWEQFVPRLELSRRLDPYSVGHGKYRSGACMLRINMIHRGRDIVGSALVSGGTHFILPNLGLGGGYPGGKLARALVRDTNAPQLMAERRPLVHEIGHPAHPDYEQTVAAKVCHPHHIPEPFMLRDGDIAIDAHGAPGGFGDPIERDTAAVMRDLDNGLATPDIAERIYGIVATYDDAMQTWRVDPVATGRRRAAKRAERLRRAVPVEQWWRAARQHLLQCTLHPLIAEMYTSSMTLSEAFAQEFRTFWALPDDWTSEAH
ncbi:MAG: hydantoinase B/oxoprolinase family protein [Candidatus Binatia bacterium]